MVGFAAVLDANVLYPFSLRDILLRLAEAELYDPYWSQRILAEVTRNLIEKGVMDPVRAARLERLMAEAFVSAFVPESAIARLEGAMTNHPKDRHVLAAAVAAGARVIVTLDIDGFPDAACSPFGIEAQHPDEFLTHLFHLEPNIVIGEIRRQADELRKPPRTAATLVDLYAAVVPGFAAEVRTRL